MLLMSQNDDILSQLNILERAKARLVEEISDNDRNAARNAIAECRSILDEVSAAIDQHEAEVNRESATHRLTLTEDIYR